MYVQTNKNQTNKYTDRKIDRIFVKSVKLFDPKLARHCGSSTPLLNIGNPLKTEVSQFPTAVRFTKFSTSVNFLYCCTIKNRFRPNILIVLDLILHYE